MKHLPLLLTCSLLTSILGIGGCASDLSGDSYSRSEALQPITFRDATILGVRKVRIQGTHSGAGLASGAVVGGIAGSSVGSGRGSVLGAAVGVVVGGLAGAAAEEGITREDAWELTLQMHSGEKMVIVQEIGKDDHFVPGQHVRVLQSSGKTRVSPAESPANTPR